MTNSQVHPQGWISLLIAPEYEERAKQMRAERDRQYGNIYTEPPKISSENGKGRFPVINPIRHCLPYTFSPILVAVFCLCDTLSGNKCFPTTPVSTGLVPLPEFSGVPAYIPNNVTCIRCRHLCCLHTVDTL